MEDSVYYTGIDAHKKTCFLVTRDITGKIVKQSEFASNGQVLLDYFSDLAGLHKVVVESTSAWYWISDAFRGEDRIELSLAHSKYLKAISYAKVKTDKVDAGTLADLHRAALVPLAHQISPELRGLRDMLRARLRLVQRQTATRNSIARILEKFNCTSVAEVDALYREQVACHQEHLTLYDKHIKRLEARIWTLVRMNEEVSWLMQLPGVGRIVAFTIYQSDVGAFRVRPPGTWNLEPIYRIDSIQCRKHNMKILFQNVLDLTFILPYVIEAFR